MSKLEELIQEYCPDGVEYVGLGDLCQIRTGKLNANAQVEDGEYPFFTCDANPYRIDTYAFDTSAIIISGNGSQVGHLNRYDGKFNAYQRTYVLDEFKDIDIEFLYHYMDDKLKPYILINSKKGSVPYITLPMIQNFKVPLPALPVQREVARILGEFSLLSAELAARKQQYEYYRDELLTFKTDVEWKTIKEIATDIYRGSGIKRDQVTEVGIPCVRYGEIYTTYNTWFDNCVSHTQLESIDNPKYFEYGDILFAITGESVEDIAKSVVYIGSDKCLAGGDIVVLKHTQNPKYLAYALETTDARIQKSKGKVKSKVVHSSVPAIEAIKVPIPSLEIQERIAHVLDNFDAICSDLKIGLPAEIEARQKQYEYYRDLLLTFNSVDNTIARQTDRQTDRLK